MFRVWGFGGLGFRVSNGRQELWRTTWIGIQDLDALQGHLYGIVSAHGGVPKPQAGRLGASPPETVWSWGFGAENLAEVEREPIQQCAFGQDRSSTCRPPPMAFPLFVLAQAGSGPLIWRIGRLQVKYHLHLSITPSLRFHTIRSKSRTRAVMAKTRLWRTRCHSSELEMPAQPGPKRKPVKGARVREDMAPKSRLFASSRCRHQRSLSTACV